MQRKILAMALVGFGVGVPVAASACDFSIAYRYTGIPTSQFAVGAGVHALPLNGDGDTYFVPAVGLAIRLSDRAAVAPVLGYCTGGDDGELVIGGTGLFNLWNSVDGLMGLNLQTHVARTSFGDGSEISIPVMASLRYSLRETLGLFGSAGVNHYRISYDSEFGDFSGSDTNPAFAAGVLLLLQERIPVSAGLTYIVGEYDNSIGLVAGLAIPIGS